MTAKDIKTSADKNETDEAALKVAIPATGVDVAAILEDESAAKEDIPAKAEAPVGVPAAVPAAAPVGKITPGRKLRGVQDNARRGGRGRARRSPKR